MVTRQEYIEGRIRTAMRYLLTLNKCPQCGNKASETIIATHSTGWGDVECTHCDHVYHAIDYIDGDPNMLAIGLPNKPWFDKDWVKRMMSDAHMFAESKKLKDEDVPQNQCCSLL